MTNLYLALMHHPVMNRKGEIITSAVTNLDLHDISRVAKTYGAQKFFVVTPLPDQKKLVDKIVKHWTERIGSKINPDRREALKLISVQDSLEDVLAVLARDNNAVPKTIATCARPGNQNISFSNLHKKLQNGAPHILMFGTAWGLADELLNRSDYVLEPLHGVEDYNHLSVRSAAAVILSRLVDTKR